MTLANPYETIEPKNTYDALRDTARYIGTLVSRDEVDAFMQDLDPTRIAHSLRGGLVKPPLSGFELLMAKTADHYGREFGDFVLGVVSALAELKQNVADGEVFVGSPRPAEQSVGL